MAEKFDETYPKDIPAIRSIQLKTADGINTINSITKENNNENSIDKTQQELMNDKGFKMVGKKGHSFPMIQPDPVEEQKKKMMEQQGLVKPENRAGSAAGNNVLVNNPNNPQPMNKVSANTQGREQMFNNMASNPGQPFPDASTTPPAPIFPNQQGSFAAYANPKRVSENLNSVDVDAEGGLKDMMKKLKEKRNTKVGNPVTPEKPEDPAMYDGLNLTEKQEDNLNPNLKAAIEEKEAEAPALIDYDAASRVARTERKINKIQHKAGAKQHKQDAKKARNQAVKHKVKSKIANFKTTQARKKELKGNAMYDGLSQTNPKSLSKRQVRKREAKGEELWTEDGKTYTRGEYDKLHPQKYKGGTESAAWQAAFGMHEKHTQISKANVNSAMRDDAAHASYLKRDITYDNRHGGNKKQMTADEKHISKLAGDIKYDVKKKRKYDNV